MVRLTELRISAVEELAELLVAMKEHSAAIALLEPVIDLHRFRDGLRGQLMRALAQSGRQTEALRQFQAYRTLLAEEVGTEPSPELAALDQAIAAGADRPPTPRDGRTAAGPRAASDRPAGRSLGVFLFTDIVGSTRLWAQHTDAMAADLAQHDLLLSTAIHEHGGTSFSMAGDSFAAVFESVDDAVAAAVAAQTALAQAGLADRRRAQRAHGDPRRRRRAPGRRVVRPAAQRDRPDDGCGPRWPDPDLRTGRRPLSQTAASSTSATTACATSTAPTACSR